MKKIIRKPENWQDFESLCKKLWGEIWDCAEIKKNGRSGQNQHGVDIYGIPKFDSEHYGIQCKGKDEYSDASLSSKEIDDEIEKAKKFSPPLKKLYFATTANKDAKIEEYVRIKDLENRKSNLFEIHLFCWEDIADLIEENKKTFDWYIRNINHKTQFSIDVSFGSENHLVFDPKLVKRTIIVDMKKFDRSLLDINFNPEENRKIRQQIDTEPQPVRHYINSTTYNKSACVFTIHLKNTGNMTIKNFKLYFQIIGEGISADTVDKNKTFLDLQKYTYDTFFYENSTNGIFEPRKEILVQKDSTKTDAICIRPTIENPQTVEIKWQLVSEDFDDAGSLFIDLNTTVIERTSVEQYEQYNKNQVILENYVVYE